MRNDHPGPSAAIRLDLTGRLFDSVENWRRDHVKIPSRAEAVRLLVERALAPERPADEAVP
jgi:hypothetical protein